MEALSENNCDSYLPIFFHEFSLYPISYIKKSQIKFFYFTNTLTFSAETYSQYRAAVPDYCDDTMALNYCCKETLSSYIRNIIHHEFFHFVDYIEDYKIYDSDPKWEACNESCFKYGNG